jgi:hypothetical protein
MSFVMLTAAVLFARMPGMVTAMDTGPVGLLHPLQHAGSSRRSRYHRSRVEMG